MGEVDRSAPVYPIGIVQKLTELTGRQIRYYEQQGLLQPQRTKGNQRLYSSENVDTLLRIKQLLATGLAIDGVRANLAGSPSEPSPLVQAPAPPQAVPSRYHTAAGSSSGAQLASLYPVNNQAALLRMLEAGREPKENPKKP